MQITNGAAHVLKDVPSNCGRKPSALHPVDPLNLCRDLLLRLSHKVSQLCQMVRVFHDYYVPLFAGHRELASHCR